MNTVQPLLTPVAGLPDLSVVTDEPQGQFLVFWGLVLMERVPLEDTLGWKLLAARLYNLGFHREALAELFEVSRTTLRRWGLALQSGDPERLRKALSGQGAERKVTTSVEAFVRFRFRELSQEVRAYAQQIILEVQEIFQLSVSASRLRLIFAEERETLQAREVVEAQPEQVVEETPPPASTPPDVGPEEGLEAAVSTAGEPACATAATEAPRAAEEAVSAASCMGPAQTISGANGLIPRQLLPVTRQISFHPDHLAPGADREPQHRFCHLAGLFLLLPQLEHWLAGWPSDQRPELIRQFCLQILAGAVNHEQSKTVESTSLKLVNGPVIRTIDHQRRLSDQLATADNLRTLAQLNLRYLDAAAQCCFYFDPHTKEYSGVEKVLKGWCGATHDIRKVLNLDAIHTADGAPCTYSASDNYEDTRVRFFAVRKAFVQLLGAAPQSLIWIFDRALYALATLRQILDLGDGFITWEKGYQHDGWDDTAAAASFRRSRPRNRHDDRRYYHFEYQHAPWQKDSRITRTIVRATGPDRPTIEVSILAANCTLSHDDTIWNMFNRWLQENDFRYQIRHMGLNELTSRAVDTYDELRSTLDDRQVESRQHKQAKRDQSNLEARFGRLLVRRERSGRRLNTTLHKLQQERRQLQQDHDQLIQQMTTWRQQLQTLPQDSPSTAATQDLLEQARQLHRRQDNYHSKHQRYLERSKLEEQLETARDNLAKLAERLEQIPATESRLQALIDDGYVRFNTTRKAFMDAIRLAARNIFYRAIAPFRQAYDNYRDDHAIYRAITRSPGILRLHGHHLQILLLPAMDVGPKLRQTLEPILDDHAAQLQDLYARSGHHLKVQIQLYDPATHRL